MAQLKLGKRYMYTPSYLDAFSDNELAEEYNRLRKIANKRLEALGRSEFATSQTYLVNKGQYEKTASQMASRSELLRKLSAVGQMVGAKTGSVRGLQRQRADSVATLRESGYTFVTKKNFHLFLQFMEQWRIEHPAPRGGEHSPTPQELAELALGRSESKLTPQKAEQFFKEWLEEKGY